MGAASTDNGPGPLAFAMIGLTSSQLKVVTSAVHMVPVEKRDLYLQRISAMLTLRGRGHYNDRDVMEVAQLALVGRQKREMGDVSPVWLQTRALDGTV